MDVSARGYVLPASKNKPKPKPQKGERVIGGFPGDVSVPVPGGGGLTEMVQTLGPVLTSVLAQQALYYSAELLNPIIADAYERVWQIYNNGGDTKAAAVRLKDLLDNPEKTGVYSMTSSPESSIIDVSGNPHVRDLIKDSIVAIPNFLPQDLHMDLFTEEDEDQLDIFNDYLKTKHPHYFTFGHGGRAVQQFFTYNTRSTKEFHDGDEEMLELDQKILADGEFRETATVRDYDGDYEREFELPKNNIVKKFLLLQKEVAERLRSSGLDATVSLRYERHKPIRAEWQPARRLHYDVGGAYMRFIVAVTDAASTYFPRDCVLPFSDVVADENRGGVGLAPDLEEMDVYGGPQCERLPLSERAAGLFEKRCTIGSQKTEMLPAGFAMGGFTVGNPHAKPRNRKKGSVWLAIDIKNIWTKESCEASAARGVGQSVKEKAEAILRHNFLGSTKPSEVDDIDREPVDSKHRKMWLEWRPDYPGTYEEWLHNNRQGDIRELYVDRVEDAAEEWGHWPGL